MNNQLKIKFKDQRYQLEAIESVVSLFEGSPKREGIDFLSQPTDEIIPNANVNEELNERLLLHNLQKVQITNNEKRIGSELKVSNELEVDQGETVNGVGEEGEKIRSPHITVEMETGTGKTYIYLRTAHELNKKYGYKKFIVVVPSIAIYQSVVKNIEATRNHFASKYDNEEISLVQYDGSKLGRIRDEYATNSNLTVMVMTIDSFNKSSNNFYKRTEQLQGEKKPYEYIQQTRPIVILDEPQNFNSKKAKSAIRTLKPLCVLRYSATHKETPNLCYRLTPVDAFKENLVKQIEVVGISELDNHNESLISLLDVTRSPIRAKVKINKLDKGVKKEREVILKQGTDLFELSGLTEYEGLIVSEIKYGQSDEDKQVLFTNGYTLSFKNSFTSKESVFRAQIEKTIEAHMIRQEALRDKGIKVLSLFFIDRVKNYTGKEAIIKRLFDESFNKLKRRFQSFSNANPEQVREGYFAKAKAEKGEEEAIDTNSSNKKERELEKAAFELIMKKKERLLSFEEPTSFIFAHSALKEGWDNPNVFQICTLNQTASNIKKRQEIGRGLRLAVDQNGERSEEHDVNILTVIANESYESYVTNLQNEYVAEGDTPPNTPKEPEEAVVKRNNKLFTSNEFQDFFEKVNRQVDYKLNINTDELIGLCVDKLNESKFPGLSLEFSQARFVISEYLIELQEVFSKEAVIEITFSDTTGNSYKSRKRVSEGDSLNKLFNDIRLKNLRVLKINDEGSGSQSVKFDNEEIITKYKPLKFSTEKVTNVEKTKVRSEEGNYAIPNFIERVAKETSLTKKTVKNIFKNMQEDKKKLIFKNPEGWISEFLSNIKEVLCNHIAENIEFVIKPEKIYEANDLFPLERKFPQKELIPAGDNGLYDKVQVDSDVEREYVGNRVIPDADKTILYFKFPPKFKISLPKIIGNYNPDWGMVRKSEDENYKVELVRETKGGVDLERLRFPHEKRKIRCAQKYFEEIGIDYRVVDQNINYWWESDKDHQNLK